MSFAILNNVASVPMTINKKGEKINGEVDSLHFKIVDQCMNLCWGGANLQQCVVKPDKFISSQADKISDENRASVFGILGGVASAAFVCGTLAARFLSTTSTFQVVPSYLSISSPLNQFFLPNWLRFVINPFFFFLNPGFGIHVNPCNCLHENFS